MDGYVCNGLAVRLGHAAIPGRQCVLHIVDAAQTVLMPRGELEWIHGIEAPGDGKVEIDVERRVCGRES